MFVIFNINLVDTWTSTEMDTDIEEHFPDWIFIIYARRDGSACNFKA